MANKKIKLPKDLELIEKRETISFHLEPAYFRETMKMLADTAKEQVTQLQARLDALTKENNGETTEEIKALAQMVVSRQTLAYLYEDAVTLAEWARGKMTNAGNKMHS